MGYTLGVDVGTTFTAAAVARDSRVEIASLGSHAATIPSLVFLRDDGEILIGDAALRRGVQEPARLAKEFKRRFGDTTPIMLDRTPFSAERLTAMILQQIVAEVSRRQGGPPDLVGIAHPANWGQFKLDLLHQAVGLADLPVATFVSEPVAAAIQYAATERVEVGDVVAVYDLGGGTFDAALLRKTVGGFDTLGQPQGIERLGGIDFDEAVFGHVREALGDAFGGIDPSDQATRAALGHLRQECVLAKEALSSDSDATIQVILPHVQTQVRLNRAEFEDMIRPPLRETVATLRRALTSANLQPSDVKVVLLVGGSSRIPLVSDLVASELGRPVVTDTHPKHTVALGAARMVAGQHASTTAVPLTAAPLVTASAAPAWDVSPDAPSATPIGPHPARPARSRRVLATIGVIALVLVGGGAAWALTRDDDPGAAADTSVTDPAIVTSPDTSDAGAVSTLDGTTGTATATTTATAASGTDSTETTESSGTTVSTQTIEETVTTTALLTCGATSRCAGIESIELRDDGAYVVAYATAGFDPVIGFTDAEKHVHFFYDTVSIDDAGTPGTGPWMPWGRPDGGGMLIFDFFTKGNLGEFVGDSPTAPRQMCIAVASHEHAIEQDTVSCTTLPDVDLVVEGG